jgi:hypothetical protein
MSTSARSGHRGCALVATLISAAFFWTLLLSVSPQLHARVHSDANRVDHTCSVTLIASGSYDHPAQPSLISAADFISEFGSIPALTSTWVRPLLLSAHIFAHAPPAHS